MLCALFAASLCSSFVHLLLLTIYLTNALIQKMSMMDHSVDIIEHKCNINDLVSFRRLELSYFYSWLSLNWRRYPFLFISLGSKELFHLRCVCFKINFNLFRLYDITQIIIV